MEIGNEELAHITTNMLLLCVYMRACLWGSEVSLRCGSRGTVLLALEAGSLIVLKPVGSASWMASKPQGPSSLIPFHQSVSPCLAFYVEFGVQSQVFTCVCQILYLQSYVLSLTDIF